VLKASDLRITILVPPNNGSDREGPGEIDLETVIKTFDPPLISRTLDTVGGAMMDIFNALANYLRAVQVETFNVPVAKRRDLQKELVTLIGWLGEEGLEALSHPCDDPRCPYCRIPS